MFIRIVKLSLKPSAVEDFLDMFEQNKNRIKGSVGCSFLELYRDKAQENVFFTYSHWEEEQNLEDYRKSDFFRNIWSGLKPDFLEKPEAWSVTRV